MTWFDHWLSAQARWSSSRGGHKTLLEKLDHWKWDVGLSHWASKDAGRFWIAYKRVDNLLCDLEKKYLTSHPQYGHAMFIERVILSLWASWNSVKRLWFPWQITRDSIKYLLIFSPPKLVFALWVLSSAPKKQFWSQPGADVPRMWAEKSVANQGGTLPHH